MKNLLLSFFLLAMTATSFAQKSSYDRYTFSGGLLGAMNYSKFFVDGQNPGDISYDAKIGWSAGAYTTISLCKNFSLEPEAMYSYYTYRSVSDNALLPNGSLGYLSVPVLFKYHFGRALAITLGPEVDMVLSVDDEINNTSTDAYTSTSFAVNSGIELFPRGRAVIYARYIRGLDNMDNAAGDDPTEEYKNANIQIGIKVKLFGKFIPADTDEDGIPDKSDNCPIEFGYARYGGCPIPDSDGDGLNDEEDKCPDQKGLAEFGGCADTDGDAIIDDEDKCPTVAGIAKYMGCPIPDTDGDGVNDEVDKCPNQKGLAQYNGCADTDKDGIIDNDDACPTVAGLAAYNGCPIPDRDKDGVNDDVDKCPDVPGLAENNGCPKIESAKFSTQRIQFVTGSATLTAASKEMIKEGAKLLNSADFKSLKVEVRGHTDSTGNPKSNMTLSDKRAKSVMDELIKNGVSADRINAVGYGDTEPIGDNKTVEGRAQNRRVAFDVKQ